MIDARLAYAVVGASSNPEKYGHRVFRDLLTAGYTVFPIHPHAERVLGQHAWRTLRDLPRPVDVVIFVVPPEVTEAVLLDVVALGIARVWFQPGSDSEALQAFCKTHGIEYRSGACIMVERTMHGLKAL